MDTNSAWGRSMNLARGARSKKGKEVFGDGCPSDVDRLNEISKAKSVPVMGKQSKVAFWRQLGLCAVDVYCSPVVGNKRRRAQSALAG